MKNQLSILELTNVSHILSSDEDQPIVMDLAAGFDRYERLVIAIDCINYDDRRFNCSTSAVVPLGDTMRLARRHHIAPAALPEFISDCMAEWRGIVNPSFAQVVDCFKEITECLLDEKCRFRIYRRTGSHGKICC